MNALKILGIDTSGRTASVAVCDECSVIAQTSVMTKLTHSQIILPLCIETLEKAKVSLDDIDRIVVSDGPGSYTGFLPSREWSSLRARNVWECRPLKVLPIMFLEWEEKSAL